ncbi:hypothetical protein SRB5_10200 [Streptomyces sp. RB5]|uniref:Uncharacterized protein n=1 Tax=Streptomyces smaragdinus TaxID=2585196 RepID=A0A7K0CBS8_9ACTN|nr:hypothetical protein [Streptomyces smaragdinus]MQY10907.1 hypothetical protein [Streptomyces smaragdinus]
MTDASLLSLTAAADAWRTAHPGLRMAERLVLQGHSAVLAEAAVRVRPDAASRGEVERGLQVLSRRIRSERVPTRELLEAAAADPRRAELLAGVSDLHDRLGRAVAAVRGRLPFLSVRALGDCLRGAGLLLREASADFTGCDLSDVDLAAAVLLGVRWDVRTRWPDEEWARTLHQVSVPYPDAPDCYVVTS